MNDLSIGVISLGCSKNRVDTENMLFLIKETGANIVEDVNEADIVIINTCGFIEEAKQESINTILTVSRLKKKKLKALIVTGCLSGRYKEELAKELPEVDAFLGVSNYMQIGEAIKQVLDKKRFVSFEDTDDKLDHSKRVITTPANYAYIKIAEGCNNCCSYCAIPIIRGPLKSRTIEDIVNEAKQLINDGIKELILIAQDTTRYGEDIYDKPCLSKLIREIAKIKGDFWIRILYSYPDKIDRELIDTIISEEKVCKYLDIPVQHLCDEILFKMNRKGNFDTIKNAVDLIRRASDDFVIRTTLISGFPGESESQHEKMLQRVEELKFDRLGVFAYSQEEGTRAAKLEGQLANSIKQRRVDEIMQLQIDISYQKNLKRVGKTYKVLVEGIKDNEIFYGRSYAEAPEVDGKIFFAAGKDVKIGEFIEVLITAAEIYDLVGAKI
ncbi:MAG: 30S ribosomal protein S12 methylthiotransferase RimO [Eubacteriales bacterium]